jgi:hypothetical protein
MEDTMNDTSPFTTTDLGVGAFLLSRGYAILSRTRDNGRLTFAFPEAAREVAEEYYQGGSCPARSFYHSLRDLRGMIHSAD